MPGDGEDTQRQRFAVSHVATIRADSIHGLRLAVEGRNMLCVGHMREET